MKLRHLFFGLVMAQLFVPLAASAQGEKARPGELVTIRSKRLFVEIRGASNAPPLLYLHGGPGAGSYDFGLYQGGILSKKFRLILMDQRGVLRSDPIGETESFGFDDIIADAEALRVRLGIKKWAVLGHSFGGYVAVKYAASHPASITRLILESPTFDLASSARALLRGAAREYQALGKKAEADEALRIAADSSAPTRELWQKFTRFTNAMGRTRNNLYVHGNDKEFFDDLVAASNIPSEMWSRSATHQKKLFAEGKLFESLIPELSLIQCPTLLIKGKYDLVTPDDQVAAFRQKVRRGKVINFNNSSHFVRVEESEKYTKTVIKFLLP